MKIGMFFKLVILLAISFTQTVLGFDGSWQYCHVTFYGGADASGTMGGACGYGNLYTYGYGTNTAALSTALFNDGASCGQCYQIVCDYNTDPWWCIYGTSVTITATNFCPPNWDQPSDNGGWCNPPRCHFDMAQPAFEQIAYYKAGIVPVWYRRVPCAKRGSIRMTINGFNYYNLILIWNVGGPGSIAQIMVSTPNSGWMNLYRNWGANWQCNGLITGQPLSFMFWSTDWQFINFPYVVSYGWIFGQTYEGYSNFW